MKVILKQDHDLLGDEGQIIEVKSGYARNYLIPNGIALTANVSNLKSYEDIQKQRSRKIQKLADQARKFASDLTENEINIYVKTGEDDRLFGSVTSQMIYDALIEKGLDSIEKKKIILKETIKTLGQHLIDIKLHQSVIAQIKVNVLDENKKDNAESIPEVTDSEVQE